MTWEFVAEAGTKVVLGGLQFGGNLPTGSRTATLERESLLVSAYGSILEELLEGDKKEQEGKEGGGGGGRGGSIRQFSSVSAGGRTQVEPGETFQIVLTADTSEGFSWGEPVVSDEADIQSVAFDGNAVRLVSSDVNPLDEPSSGPQKFIFTFSAERVGRCTVDFFKSCVGSSYRSSIRFSIAVGGSGMSPTIRAIVKACREGSALHSLDVPPQRSRRQPSWLRKPSLRELAAHPALALTNVRDISADQLITEFEKHSSSHYP